MSVACSELRGASAAPPQTALRVRFWRVRGTIPCARLRFRELKLGESIRLGRGIQVRTAPLRHPDGATGYIAGALALPLRHVSARQRDRRR
jgi:hypothetical protein